MKKAEMMVTLKCDGCGKEVEYVIDLATADILDEDAIFSEIASQSGFYLLNNGEWCDDCYALGELNKSSDDGDYFVEEEK